MSKAQEHSDAVRALLEEWKTLFRLNPDFRGLTKLKRLMSVHERIVRLYPHSIAPGRKPDQLGKSVSGAYLSALNHSVRYLRMFEWDVFRTEYADNPFRIQRAMRLEDLESALEFEIVFLRELIGLVKLKGVSKDW